MAFSGPAKAQTGVAASPSSSQLPNLGDGTDMTTSAERHIGDRIAREIYRDPDYIDDPVLVDYVQGIWQPLLASARLRGEITPELDERFAWEILLGKDRSVNAFALPGGYFGLYLGLIGVVTSRDELASVLGHELSHVTQRHIARVMAKQSSQTPLLVGAMILGALAASKSPDAAGALIVGGQAVAAQNQLNFSRDMEREADRVGYGVMSQAGFAPQAFITMFDKLANASRLNDSGAFPYLRSHPLTTERMADMQARLPAGVSAQTALAPDLAHAMVSARARVWANPGVDALRTWGTQAASADFAAQPLQNQAATLYGAAFAAVKQRDFAAAQGLLARLGERTRDAPAAARLTRWLAIEAALAQGNATQAMQILTSASVHDETAKDANGKAVPESPKTMPRALLLLAAQAQTGSGQAGLATQNLQTWVAAHPRDGTAWLALAGAYNAQGQQLRAVRAEAEAQVAQLNFAAAQDRFKAAQELARALERAGRGDHIEASIVDTRARQVALTLREQALER